MAVAIDYIYNMLQKLFRVKIPQVISKLSAILFLVAGFAYDMMYFARYGRDYLDSDMAAEMILSDILNKSHSILSTDWAYSSELRVFEMQWFYRIGLVFFPNNWPLARAVGVAMALVILALGIFLCAKAAGLGEYSYWAAAFAMWPLGFWYCWQSIFGGYYLPYPIFSFFSLFCMVKLAVEQTKIKRTAFWVFLAMLAFASGLNGVRQMMVFYAPLLLAGILVRNKKAFFPSAIYAAFWNALGYLVNMLYFAKHYAFVTQDEYRWGGGTNNLLVPLKWYYESFGYCQNYKLGFDNMPLDISLFSFAGIAAGLGLALGAAILASSIYLILIFRKLNDMDQFLAAAGLSMIVVIGFVFCYLHGARQYWQQTHAFGFILLLVAIKNLNLEHEAFRFGAVLLAALFTAVSAKGTVQASIKMPLRAYVGLSDVVEWVEENTDYTHGVASFWYSGIVTELSDGRIEMYTVNNHEEPTEVSMWLQKISHKEEFPLSHYFVICQHSDEGYQGTYLIDELYAECIYDDGEYAVYAVE